MITQNDIYNAQSSLDKLFRNLARQKATVLATEAQITITTKHIKELELELELLKTDTKKRP